MYVFNKIMVTPQLPKRIGRLSDIANNLWWSWNTDFLRIFKEIDIDLWERVDRNPESGIEGLLYAGYRDYEQLRI